MAKVVDPDALALIVDGAPSTEEVSIDTDLKTIEIRLAGDTNDDNPGSTSGVTLQCIYSFLKEEWKTNATLNKFKFPLKAIYEAKFIWRYGWQPANDQTRDILRDAGWQEIDGSEYACMISLGSQVDDTQQGNYQQTTGFDQATTDFDKTGPLNEAVQIFDGGSADYRDYLKLFLRVWQNTYADYSLLVEQGFAALTYIAYRAPLANAVDIKNTGTTEAYIDTPVDPYQDMELQYYRGALFETAAVQSYSIDDVVQDGVGRWARCTGAGDITSGEGGAYGSFVGSATWEAYPGERLIVAGVYSAFNREVQYNGAATKPDKDEIYKFCQQRLRKASDINDDPDTETYGTVNGEVAVKLAYYVGDILHSWPGVNFADFNTNITNTIVLHDIKVDTAGLDSEDVPKEWNDLTYPFTAAGNMVFSANLVAEDDGDTLYRMYFKNIREQTQADFAVTGASGAAATLGSTLADLSNIAQDDYFIVSGFLTNAVNNGVKQATGNGVANSVDYVDALGQTQIDETSGDTVTLEEQPYDTLSAIVTDDNGDVDISGEITAQTIGFDFDYDGNVQGGRDSGEDAKVVVVAQGLEGAEIDFAEFTITRTTGLNFPVNVADELTYANPT
jgi:hypothetical protein